jgi:hypothetical protein
VKSSPSALTRNTWRQVTNSTWFSQAAAMVHRPYQCVKQQYWRGFAALWPFWSGISGARDESKTCPGRGSLGLGDGRPGTAWFRTHMNFWSVGQTGMTNEYVRVYARRDSTRLATSLVFIVHGRGGQLRDLAGWLEWLPSLTRERAGSPVPWRYPGAPPWIAADRIDLPAAHRAPSGP